MCSCSRSESSRHVEGNEAGSSRLLLVLQMDALLDWLKTSGAVFDGLHFVSSEVGGHSPHVAGVAG